MKSADGVKTLGRQPGLQTSAATERVTSATDVGLAHRRGGSSDQRVAQVVVKYVALLWGLAIVVGLILHVDLPREELTDVKLSLPMLWFDNLLRRYGALIPLPAFLIRWWVAAVARPSPDRRPAAHFAEAFCLYLGLSTARFLVYFLHVIGVLHWILGPFIPLPVTAKADEHREHLMSDHLFLAASITAILTTETILGLGDLLRTMQHRLMDRFRLFCLCIATALSAGACLLTIGDMYYTARFFHGRLETFGAAALGSLLFQGPLAYWVMFGFPPETVAHRD